MDDRGIFLRWTSGEHPVIIAKNLDIPLLSVLNAIQRFYNMNGTRWPNV